MLNKNIVKFSRLLYRNDVNYVIEFEVNNKLKLWYNLNKYQGWNKPNYFNTLLSDTCLIHDQIDLLWLFINSPITHFEKDLPNVEYAYCMFEDCKDLIYFKSKMPNVKDTGYMFYGCSDEFFNLHPHLRDL